MNQKAITKWSRTVLIVAVLLCRFLVVGLLLTAVSFGIECGDLDANPHIQVQDQLRLDCPGNIAALGCLVLEIAATWALVKALNRRKTSRVQTGILAVLAFIGLSFLSYAIVFAAP
jgi:hypothetical protein